MISEIKKKLGFKPQGYPLPPDVELPNPAFARKQDILFRDQPLAGDISEWNLQYTAEEVCKELCFDLWYDASSAYKNLHALGDLSQARRHWLLDEAAAKFLNSYYRGPVTSRRSCLTPGMFFDGGLDFRWEQQVEEIETLSISQNAASQAPDQESPGTGKCLPQPLASAKSQDSTSMPKRVSFKHPEKQSRHQKRGSGRVEFVVSEIVLPTWEQSDTAIQEVEGELHVLPKTTYDPSSSQKARNSTNQEAIPRELTDDSRSLSTISSRTARSFRVISQWSRNLRRKSFEPRKLRETRRGGISIPKATNNITSFGGTIDEDTYYSPTLASSSHSMDRDLASTRSPREPKPLIIRKQPSKNQNIASDYDFYPPSYSPRASSLRGRPSIDFDIRPSHESRPTINSANLVLSSYGEHHSSGYSDNRSTISTARSTVSSYKAPHMSKSPEGIMGDFVPINSPDITPVPAVAPAEVNNVTFDT
jgi:hypothetical protein